MSQQKVIGFGESPRSPRVILMSAIEIDRWECQLAGGDTFELSLLLPLPGEIDFQLSNSPVFVIK